jgi:hypothetical protein
MMGRQRRQVMLSDVEALSRRPIVPDDSFHGRMAAYGDKLIR